MCEKIKVIKIDPAARTVTDEEIERGLAATYAAIGCSVVTRVVLDTQNDIWLDENGLLHDPQPEKFLLGDYPQPLAGTGLICGYDAAGNTIGTTVCAAQVIPFVQWLGARHVEPEVFFMSWDSFKS